MNEAAYHPWLELRIVTLGVSGTKVWDAISDFYLNSFHDLGRQFPLPGRE